MFWTERHVLCCTAIHCMKKGSSTVAGRLRIELRRRGLDERVMCNTCDSIEVCDMGPNIVVYPEGIIYAGVQVSDIKDIIAHLEGGPPVERLILTPDREDELNRRSLYEATVAEGEQVAMTRFAEIVAEHGLDDAWITEQRARGFIAVRDAEDGQGRIVIVTSKARLRYFIPSAARLAAS
jgi:(2Fe-2S) ferredoxin